MREGQHEAGEATGDKTPPDNAQLASDSSSSLSTGHTGAVSETKDVQVPGVEWRNNLKETYTTRKKKPPYRPLSSSSCRGPGALYPP